MSEDVKPQTPAIENDKLNDETMPFKAGQVVKLEELDELMSKVEEDRKDLQELFDKNLNKFESTDIVKGRILDISSNYVVVDIGFKSEGILPLEEFIDIDKFKVGDEVELFLDSAEDVEGNVQVSRRKVYFLRAWDRLMKVFENGEIIQGRIVRRIKGGFVVDLDGVDAFLPGSQVDVKPIRDFDAFVGTMMDLKIVKVNEQRKNIVVSRRAIIEKELESKRAEILQTLEKGQVRRGVVKNITDFGVFIDLGGVDGLLHITDLSWGRVNHPSELVELDQEIDVMILDFDEKKTRISLGLKQLKPHPWENIAERFPIGSKVKGKVVSLTDYGAFVELEHGIEGLIHVSEMSWSHHIKNPSQILKVGDEVEAVLLSIEPDERKISLGLKQLTPDPWEEIEQKFPVGSKHRGIVRNLTPFGAFVELEEGIDGLVHISDLSWTRKIRHPSEVIRKGEEIDVIVLDINKEERRIALGHKQIESNPWDAFEEAYQVGTEVLDGKISRLIDKGVIVSLPLGVDAFVPLRELGIPNIKRAADHFKVGDTIPLKVIEFDKENKRIVLSASEYLKDKESEIVEAYMAEHTAAPVTLKDLVEEVPDLEEEPEAGKGRKPSSKKKKAADAEEAEADSKAESSESEKQEKDEAVEEKSDDTEESKEK
jgi:small subunit ribosomal protein S1